MRHDVMGRKTSGIKHFEKLGQMAVGFMAIVLILVSSSIAEGTFSHRKSITLTKSTGGNLNNFPVMVSISGDTDSTNRVQSADGHDIMFMASDGTTPLDFEIESFDRAAGDLVAWVKIPLFQPGANLIYMYYGNAQMTSSPATSCAVWGPEAIGVWHLDENGAGSLHEYEDSSAFSNHGQGGEGDAADVPSAIAGQIGTGQHFNYGEFIDCGDDAVFDVTGNEITLQAWVQHNVALPVLHPYGIINHKGYYDGWSLWMQGDNTECPGAGGCVQFHAAGEYNSNAYQLKTNTTLSSGSWHHVVATYDGSNMRVYIDGVADGVVLPKTDSIPPSTAEQDVWIGHGDQPDDVGWSGEWDGEIDEVRVIRASRTPDWIATEYDNQTKTCMPASAFCSVGETAGPYTDYSIVTNYRSIGAETGNLASSGDATSVSGSKTVTFGSVSLPLNIGQGDKLTLDPGGTPEVLYILSRDSETQVTVQTASTSSRTVSYAITRAYNTLAAWEIDIGSGGRGGDLVLDNRREIGVAYNDGPFTAGVTIDGSTTDCVRTLTLTGRSGQQHSGVAGTGVVIDNGVSSTPAVRVIDDYVTVEWFEIKGGTGLNGGGIEVANGVSSANFNALRYNIIHDTEGDGIRLSDADSIVEVFNNIIYDANHGIRYTVGMTDDSRTSIFNNTIYNCLGSSGSPSGITSDVAQNRVRIDLRNNIAHSNTNGDYGLIRPFEEAYFYNNTTTSYTDVTSDLADRTSNYELQFDEGTDYFYVGSSRTFRGIWSELATSGVPNNSGLIELRWEYWNGGGWVNVASVAGFTDGPEDLQWNAIIHWWDDLPSWSTTTVNGGSSLYYVRARLVSDFYTTFPRERMMVPAVNVGSRNNLASDLTASYHSPFGGGGSAQDSVGIGAVSFLDIASGTENLHIDHASTAKNNAVDLTAFFFDDIDAATRSAPWDIGADDVGISAETNYRSIGTRDDYGTSELEGPGTTVTASTGSTQVTGSGTQWVTANRGRGDVITIDGTDYQVLSVDAETQLRLRKAFTGTTGSGKSYTVARQYDTIEAWENCIDGGPCAYFPVASASLVSDDRIEVGIAYKDSVFQPAGQVQIDGSTTDADHTITLTVDGYNRHYGIPGSGVIYQGTGTGDNGLVIEDAYVTVEWLEFRGIFGGNNMASIRVYGDAAPEGQNAVISHVLIYDFADGNGSNDVMGIRFSGALSGKSATVRNSMIWNGDKVGIEADTGGDTLLIENCSIDHMDTANGVGIDAVDSTVTVKNTIVTTNPSGDFVISGTGSYAAASSNNISSDGTAPGSNELTLRPATSLFVTPNSDLHLKSGVNEAVDAGMTLSPSFFDIDGADRSGVANWDRGADERDATGGFLTLSNHTAGQAVDKFESAASVTDVLFRFRLIRSGAATVDTLRVHFTTDSGVSNGDVASGELWVDSDNDGVGDSQILPAVVPSSGVLTFDTNFTPATTGTDYVVRVTVNNLSGNDRTTFSLTTADIDEVELGVLESGSATPAVHVMGTTAKYRSIGTRGNYGTSGPEGLTTTVTATAGSSFITGAGTQWQSFNRGRGDRITIDGGDYTILSVESENQLILTAPYLGTTGSGLSYTISRKFTTLQDWEDCLDSTTPCEGVVSASLISDGRFEVGIAYEDSIFTAGVAINGSTTDATHNITLTVDPGNRHNGRAGSGVILDGQDTDQGIRVQDDYTVLEWFEFKQNRGAASAASVVVQEASNLLIQNLLIYDFDDASNFVSGIRAQNNVGYTVRNCIIYDGDSACIRNNEATATGTIQNCTLYSSQRGVLVGAGTVTVTNTIAVGNAADFEGSMTGSHNMSTDATAFTLFANDPNAITGAASASEFVDDTVATADLHLKIGAQAIDAGTDLSGSFTNDIDDATRFNNWDMGADEGGSCACDLLQTTTGSGTITVSAPGSFELTFDTFTGGAVNEFYDLAEDPARSNELAGSLNPRGLHNFGMRFSGANYNATTNDEGSKLTLLETTPTRVRVRQESFYENDGTGNLLAGIKGVGDYGVYPSGRSSLIWRRIATAGFAYQTEYAEQIVHHTAAPLDTWVAYFEAAGAAAGTGEDDFVLTQIEASGARTDFLSIMYRDWVAGPDHLATASLTDSGIDGGTERLNAYWYRTPGGAISAGDIDTWNFLTYFKPTNFSDHNDAAVTSRSDDYRLPDDIAVGDFTAGSRWDEDGNNDGFNESEAAYTVEFDTSNGLTLDMDGGLRTRYQPFFKVVQWRSLQDPTVTLEGASLGNGSDFNADVKPVARAHFAQDLLYHSTLQSAGDFTSPDVGSGGFVPGGVTFGAARYGNGGQVSADGHYFDFPTADFDAAKGAIEFWFQPAYDHSDNVQHDIAGFVFNGSNHWLLRKDASNDLNFQIVASGAVSSLTVGSASYSWDATEWVHIRMEWDDNEPIATQMRLIINGVEPNPGGGSGADYLSSNLSLTGGFRVGDTLHSASFSAGIYDEIRSYGGSDTTPRLLAHGGLTSHADEYLASTSNNYTLDFTAVDGDNRGEYFYIGSDSKFRGLNMQLATPGEYTVAPDLQWQYWNGTAGAWANLEAVGGFTDETVNLTEPDGTLYWTSDPANWSPYSVNGGPDLYYVRAYLDSGNYATTAPVERQIKTDILLFQYCGNIAANAQTFSFGMPLPTAVELLFFDAKGLDRKIELTWETGSEIDNLGFNLYRSTSLKGAFEKITPTAIPGLGSSPQGAQYSYTDTGLTNGVTYYYKLEDIETSGKTELHGPVFTTPQEEPEEPETDEESSSPVEEDGPNTSRITVGDPTSSELSIVEENTGGILLELVTGGFYATPQADGTVELEIPGFVLTSDTGLPSLPVRRSWVEVVAGLKVKLVSTETFEEESFEGLKPSVAGTPIVKVNRRGTVRAARKRARRSNLAHRFYPEESSRLMSVAYQEDVKKALLELAPLRWDEKQQRLVLAHRLVVRLAFEGRDKADRVRDGWRARSYRRRSSQLKQQVVARLVTRDPGLYGVSYREVFGSGQKGGVPSNWLRISRHGKAVAYHLSPDTNRFAPGATLYFMSDGSKANPYGTEAVYELEVGVAGETMKVKTASPRGEPTQHYWEKVEKEEERLYQSTLVEAEDLWLWSQLFAPVTKRFPFDVSAPADATESSRLTVWLQGASDFDADPDHHVSLYVNGAFVAESSWDGTKPRKMEVDLLPGTLVEGENQLEIENVGDTDAQYSMVYLDRFRIRYPRLLRAKDGLLEGTWHESGTAAIEGLSGGASVIEIGASPVWLAGLESTDTALEFRVEEGKIYLAANPEAVKNVVEVRKPAKIRWKKAGNRADYVMIGPRAFLETAQLLLELRQSQGLRAKVVAIEDVYSEFGFGEERPEAIRDFLTYAYHSWKKAPRYVVLLGDATFDFEDRFGTGVKNQVPPLMVMTSYIETVSDPAYAAVNGDDLLPDLAIGRLPAATVEELARMVAKILAWEAGGGELRGETVLVADNPDRGGDFVADAEALSETVLSSQQLKKIYMSELGATATRAEIQRVLNEGASLLNYIGHGAIHLWADENILNIFDVPGLSPQSEQPMLLTMNCLNGYFHFPFFGSLSEELLKAQDKGVIAAFSPSGLSINRDAHMFHKALLEELLSGTHSRLGDAVMAAQSRYAETGALPEMIAIYHLFGDPAMKLN